MHMTKNSKHLSDEKICFRSLHLILDVNEEKKVKNLYWLNHSKSESSQRNIKVVRGIVVQRRTSTNDIFLLLPCYPLF